MGVGFDADAIDAGAAFVVADVFPGELQLLKGDVEHGLALSSWAVRRRFDGCGPLLIGALEMEPETI